MKVILLRDVRKLGKKYDLKDVSSGYALNMLIPAGDAIAATPAAIRKAEQERAAAEGERKVQEELVASNISQLDGLTINISEKANTKGHLFAGLHREEIAAELKKQSRLDIAPSFIDLEHPLKTVGEHTVTVKAGGKTASFKILIQAR